MFFLAQILAQFQLSHHFVQIYFEMGSLVEDLTDLPELLSLPAVFLLLDADLGSLTPQ